MTDVAPGHWQVTADNSGLARLQQQAAAWLDGAGVAARCAQHVLLALDELAANVVQHGVGASWISLRLALDADAIELELHDDGVAFDPTGHAVSATAAPTLGGYGLKLVRQLACAFEYARAADNCVRLRLACERD